MKKYLLYVMIIFASYPILRYFYFLLFDRYTPELDFFVAVRTYWSAPLLILSGIIIIRLYKQRVLGFLSICMGLFVIVLILKALTSF